jgi:hypothetical protein
MYIFQSLIQASLFIFFVNAGGQFQGCRAALRRGRRLEVCRAHVPRGRHVGGRTQGGTKSGGTKRCQTGFS